MEAVAEAASTVGVAAAAVVLLAQAALQKKATTLLQIVADMHSQLTARVALVASTSVMEDLDRVAEVHGVQVVVVDIVAAVATIPLDPVATKMVAVVAAHIIAELIKTIHLVYVWGMVK
jgi:hypothetical protein